MESEEAASLSAPPNIDLYVGREFSCYQEFQDVLDSRKKLRGDRWVVKKSYTAQSYNKIIDNTNHHVPKHLKYYDVSLRCIHEGERSDRNSNKRKEYKFHKT